MLKQKIVLCAVLLFVPVLLASYVNGAPVVIRFSHVTTETSPKGQMAIMFKSLVEERLKDRFTVEVYPNSQLFSDDQSFEALLMDDIQLAAPSVSKFNKYNKKLQIFDLPFLFQDIAAAGKFQKSLEGNYLLFNFVERGIIGLGYLNNGLKQMSATQKLLVPSDAEGLKFRIMNSEVLEAQFRALGAEAIPKPFSQVYSLLSSGAIDGQENTWSNILGKKFHTVQPYITETNHGLNAYVIVTSVNFWESLSAEDQGELQAILDESIAFGNELAIRKEKSDRQKVIDSKTAEVLSITREQRARWVEAMKPVWAQYQDQIGEDLIKAALGANK